MNDPDMILRVNAETDGLSLVPMVGQRFWEERINLEARYLHHFASALSGHLFKEGLAHTQRGKHREKHCADHYITPSVHSPSSSSAAAAPPCPCCSTSGPVCLRCL